jgi:hypothetical protein
MDHFEQRGLLKFLFLKGLKRKEARIDLSSVLEYWRTRLLTFASEAMGSSVKDGDLSCEHDDLPGRPFSDLSDGI